jgi:lipopolysaccharide biosynthesis glycosyltransferase
MLNLAHRIHICSSIDENYAPHLAVLIRSLSQTNPGPAICVHVLHDNVFEGTQKKVEASAREVQFRWYAVTNHKTLEFKPFLQISRAAYVRLSAPQILPADLPRIIYLDVDMVVNGLIDELWATDLRGLACAAVADPGISGKDFATENGLRGDGDYFNSGVMVLDLQMLRAHETFDKAIELIAAPNNYEFPDQDALNVVLWQAWVKLDKKWNFQRRFLYDGLKHETPRIIHFTEQTKPWQRQEWHPYAWLYLRNLLRTPFYKEVLQRGGIGPLLLLKRFLKYQFST